MGDDKELIDMRTSGDCYICRLVRLYLLLALPLVAILGVGSLNPDESGSPIWFARVQLIDYLAWGALIGLFVILCFRGYVEFWVPRRRKAALERLLADNETQE